MATSMDAHGGPNIPSPDLLLTLQDLARETVLRTGDLLREMRASAIKSIETKKHANDVVTAADRTSETFMTQVLRKMRPDDGIVGEEGTRHNVEADIVWYEDPIDSTKGFVYGGGPYAVILGAEYRGIPIIGGILLVPTSEIFSAALGLGAHKNGQQIKVSGRTDLSTALVSFGSSLDDETKVFRGTAEARIHRMIGDKRVHGCGAADYCMVAQGGSPEGGTDAAINWGGGKWDILGGTVIAREAGAIVASPNFDSLTPAENLVATPALYPELARELKALGPPPQAYL